MPGFLRHTVFATAVAVLLSTAARGASAQCMLANPSFEIGGQSGAVFGGWNQFGPVGSVTTAVHGAKAARVSGPNTGGWDLAGFWQAQTSVPGDRWAAEGFVRVPSSSPLAGQSRAIVNIEWRNSGGGLISYESHDVATAATARDTFLAFAFTSAAAPAGTVSARLVFGVLQGPGDPQRQAYFDRLTFEKQTVPNLDATQWNDFASGRSVSFSGRTWRVKGTGYYGPGPNMFSNATDAVWVDGDGRLHLTIRRVNSTWYSTEVALTDALGYGDYVFTTRGRLDTFDVNTVLGLFVWEYGPCWDPAYLWWNPYNETDIEFSRWGVAGGPNAQFVTQPYDWGGNIRKFTMTFAADEVTSHAFRWLPDRIEYRSWRGGTFDEATSAQAQAWTYTGPHIPRPDQPRVHMNLWYNVTAPVSAQEAVIERFRFAPWPAPLLDATPAPPPSGVTLAPAGRHPSRGGATLRCTLPRASRVSLAILDVGGRLVRELDAGALPAGAHEIAWDGRDAAGAPVAPGVYLARLSAGAAFAVARLVVLR